MEIDLHYYQFNIGDYASHTRHLSPIEDLAYRRLLDLYYLHERPLNPCSTTVARLIGLSSHPKEVEAILIEFFQLSDDGYVNPRADKEIAHYHAKSQQASRAGKASAERRFNARSTDVQPNKKQEPITIKQETKENTKRLKALSRPPDVQESVWDDFCQHRKAQRSAITQTAIDGIEREAKKAGWTLEAALSECVLRGWRGFKADWVKSGGKSNINRQEALEARNKAIGDAWLAQESEIES
jgi:uncharacterized protein YdaU (DUF1376 family)